MTIHFNLYGDADQPLLVFLHGGGVSGWMWQEQVNYFTNYQCLVPDFPGHGESRGGCKFSIEETANQMLAMIEKHKMNRQVIVVGFSLGAQVLISMISRSGHLIDKAIIVSALTKPFAFPKYFAKVATWCLPLARIKTFSHMQAKYMYLNDQYFNTYYQETLAITKETFFRVMYENMSFSIPKGFETTRSKILVLIGKKENSMIKKSFVEILDKNEHCLGIVVPGVGHGISLYNPTYFNELIEGWIENEEIPKDITFFRHPNDFE